MAIPSSDKLVVVKAFAMGNPLPLDAREIWDSLAEAKAYAASNATAYAGQTIKVVEDGVVTVYNLVPSDVEGENYALAFAGSSGGGIQDIGTSDTEGNFSVVAVNGDTTTTKTVPVVGALVNPVVDEDEHTLTLTKIGATADKNTEVVIPLGGASPEDGIVSGVEVAEDGVSLKITTFDPETETESTETIKLSGVVGSLKDIEALNGLLTITSVAEDGSDSVETKALVGSVINPTYDAENKVLTIPVVSGVAEDGSVTTTSVAVDMKDIVASAFVDVTHTADTEDASAKYEFKYKDADGADQTKTVYETGVRKVEAGSTADKIKVTTAGTNGALSAAELLIGAGSVKNPEYDAETRKITLPILQADGSTQALEINLGKDMVVKSGSYDADAQEIVLVLTDDSEVKIPATSLVDIYTGGATNTVSVTVGGDNVITASVKLSTVEGNLVKSDENGIYVVESDFVATKQLIVDAQAAAEQHADDAVAAEAEARDEAIATAKGEAIESSNGYTDEKIAAEAEARNGAIATAKGEAIESSNGYTDEKIAAEVTARDAAIATAKGEATAYTDEKIAAEVEARNGAIATAKGEANTYTDEKIAAEVTARDEAIATAKGEANTHAEQQATGALTSAKVYTDEKIAAEVTARDEAIATAKDAANDYTDKQVAAEATSRDTAIATAKGEANTYAEQQASGALTSAKAYTDEKIAAEVTARDAAIKTSSDSMKEYVDQEIAKVTTTWVDFGA